MEMLQNYYSLTEKVDRLVANVMERYGAHITCAKGCDSCCRNISITLVEAAALATALKQLPQDLIELLRAGGASSIKDGPCPLLQDGACALYSARPIICRTHGLPILVNEEGRQRVDFCRMNFRNAETISGDAVIAVETLNTILAAVNKLFVEQFEEPIFRNVERLGIGEALMFEW